MKLEIFGVETYSGWMKNLPRVDQVYGSVPCTYYYHFVQMDRAVQILLEGEPNDGNYYTDALRWVTRCCIYLYYKRTIHCISILCRFEVQISFSFPFSFFSVTFCLQFYELFVFHFFIILFFSFFSLSIVLFHFLSMKHNQPKFHQ